MPQDILTEAELAALREFDSPTISNAIETFDVRPRNVGFSGPELQCMFPEFPPMVGYAATSTIQANQPGAGARNASRSDYWDYILSTPAPRIAVIQDLDHPRAVGSFWGEVNSNIHKALGCLGTVTDGGVRDLDEVRSLGFQMLAAYPIVSHAYIHLVDFGTPVEIFGMHVNPGDLVHADKHGAIVIPHEIARDIPAAARGVIERESVIIECCKSPDFSVEKLRQASGLYGRK